MSPSASASQWLPSATTPAVHRRRTSTPFSTRSNACKFTNSNNHGAMRCNLLNSVVSEVFRGGDAGESQGHNNNSYVNHGGFDGVANNNNNNNNNNIQDIPGQIPPPMGGSNTDFNYQTSMANTVNVQQHQTSGEFVDVMGANSDPTIYGYRETVEDRIAAWRLQQQQLQQTQSAAEAASAVDEQGRFKLFTTVSRVSVSFFFFILMWRTVHHYELADATFGNLGRGSKRGGMKAALLRTVVVTPLVVLFLGEMMGVILGLTGGGVGGGGASHATKKRLKGILNLHKGVELVMLVYNVVRLAILPSKYIVREVYIGRTISNFFFLMQAQLYTKLSWDDVSKTTIGDGYGESYYDDYTPEASAYENEFASWQNSQSNNFQQQNQYQDMNGGNL
ncbi:predicted protein [Thalassiosira pseudonana CCMP1335]|uniref:Uncharacterized protein n=1 Tax=Thalassiosira pseudonana TaxID=35128 RepID=B8CB99_THAPS|nr:predicted protein [Thalassiosira pseudonana CCMP1335]EED89281.1 predicted protein [Thalassiosira pseudonana CCMP1335]